MGLIFDGVDIEAEYGIVVDGADTWAKPERDREAVHVPGRSGDLIYDNGSWHNVEIEYHCLIEHGFADRFDAFCDWLYSHLGYFRFEDQLRHPGVYRMAEFYGPLEPETIFRDHAGKFDLKFNCKPQQWLESGEVEVDLTYSAWVKGYYSNAWQGDTFVEVDDNTAIATPLMDISDVEATTPWPRMKAIVETDGREQFVTFSSVAYDANFTYLGGGEVNYDLTGSPGTHTLYGEYRDNDHITDLPSGTKYIRLSFFCSTGIDYSQVGYSMGDIADTGENREYAYYEESSALINNETNYTARPIIEVDAPAGVNFTINNYTIEISGDIATGTLIIDCELEDCYSYDASGEVVSQNGYVAIECSDDKELSDFPYIIPGENTFHALINSASTRDSADFVSAIRMKPNWYRI